MYQRARDSGPGDPTTRVMTSATTLATRVMRLTKLARWQGRGPRAPPRARLASSRFGRKTRLAPFSSFCTSKRGAFEPSITQTFYSPPLRSCIAWVLHTTKLPAIAKAFTALDSGEPHVSGRWRSLALPVRRARRAVPFADVAEEECLTQSLLALELKSQVAYPSLAGRRRRRLRKWNGRLDQVRATKLPSARPCGVMKPLTGTTERGAPQAASSIAFLVLFGIEDGWGQRYSPLPLPNRFHCLGRTRTPFCRVSQQMQMKSSLRLRKSRSCNRSRLRHERAGARVHICTYANA
jgi:hypothetical protein